VSIPLIVVIVLLFLMLCFVVCLICYIRSQKRKHRAALEAQKRQGRIDFSEPSDSEKVARNVNLNDPYDVAEPEGAPRTAIVVSSGGKAYPSDSTIGLVVQSPDQIDASSTQMLSVQTPTYQTGLTSQKMMLFKQNRADQGITSHTDVQLEFAME